MSMNRYPVGLGTERLYVANITHVRRLCSMFALCIPLGLSKHMWIQFILFWHYSPWWTIASSSFRSFSRERLFLFLWGGVVSPTPNPQPGGSGFFLGGGDGRGMYHVWWRLTPWPDTSDQKRFFPPEFCTGIIRELLEQSWRWVRRVSSSPY
jgi:hypothetical protein